MNEFVIELNILVSIFTREREKCLSKLFTVIHQISETARNKPQLPLALAWAFRPRLGQPGLCAAKHNMLPWLVCAGNLRARKLASLSQNHFLDQGFIAGSGKSLCCSKHKAWAFHMFPATYLFKICY